MNDQLPTEFDLVIVGTGMIESILSAAASRIGKTVLHIDSNDYYGGQWASFNLKALHDFVPKRGQCAFKDPSHLPIGNDVVQIRDFESQWHVPQRADEDSIAGNLEQLSLDQAVNAEALITNKRVVEHSQESLLEVSRKFNIDLVPKVHYARGNFVELLISSNIARYAEYRSVSRVLTCTKNKLEVVPCSRADVFASKSVSVIEKRLLMKLLTSLDSDAQDFQDEGQHSTLLEFLQAKKMPPNLIHFVLYAMARSCEKTPLKEGIANTKRFLASLGRFGKTPFLFSMYGSGETPQAFCRLSAVFGGIFALNQEFLSGLKLENNRVQLLQTGKQEIKAEHFVLGVEQAPAQFVRSTANSNGISRAVLITDKSLMASEQEHLTLLLYPPEEQKHIVTILETGSLTGTCPKGFYLVHLTTKLVTSPKEDFQHIVKQLFGSKDDEDKPKILWSCYFTLPETELQHDLPENLFLCSGPDLDLDYDETIEKAKEIFHKMYPGLEFLPRAPDPDEIIIGDEEGIETGAESDEITADET